MSYSLNPLPFVDSFDPTLRAQPKLAASRCAEFVRAVPARIAELSRVAETDWVYSRKTIDDAGSSFHGLCDWVDSMDCWHLVEGEAKRERLIVLDPTHADVLEQLARESRDHPDWELTPVGISVVTDLGIAFGEYVRIRRPWAAWTFENRKSNLFYGQPCVGWFDGNLNRSIVVRQFTYVAMARARERGASLAQELSRTINFHFQKSNTPGSRTRWTR
jgi:hypothetical protein